MKKFIVVLIFLPILFATTADSQPKVKAKPKETPPYDVVTEYVRSLCAVHKIQQSAISESEGNENNHVIMAMSAIRSFACLKLELNLSIRILRGMKLKREMFDDLLPTTISIYKEKIKLFDEAQNITKKMISATAKPGVDYEKMAARMPEITAKIEYLDETQFQSMVLVCALLIDDKPDREGRMSHFNISSEQKKLLIDKIDSVFGESLNIDNKNYTVASAFLVKKFLQQGHLTTDEWKQSE